jgi:protocatechuate 3,4-dioxygenase beta subunit
MKWLRMASIILLLAVLIGLCNAQQANISGGAKLVLKITGFEGGHYNVTVLYTNDTSIPIGDNCWLFIRQPIIKDWWSTFLAPSQLTTGIIIGINDYGFSNNIATRNNNNTSYLPDQVEVIVPNGTDWTSKIKILDPGNSTAQTATPNPKATITPITSSAGPYPNASITGRVLDSDGMPVANAIVTLYEDGNVVHDGGAMYDNPQASAPYVDIEPPGEPANLYQPPSEGSYQFIGIYPGNYTLTAEIDGYTGLEMVNINNDYTSLVDITLKDYHAPSLSPTQMAYTGGITGNITDLQGILADDTNVTLWQNGQVVRIPMNPQISYRNGTYLFEHLAPGEYQLTSEVQGHKGLPVSVNVTNNTVNVNLTIQGYYLMLPPSPTPLPTLTPQQLTYKGAITGFVFDGNGTIIPGALVRLWQNGLYVKLPDNPQQTESGLNNTTAGAFKFDHLSPGLYQITAEANIEEISQPVTVDVINGTLAVFVTIENYTYSPQTTYPITNSTKQNNIAVPTPPGQISPTPSSSIGCMAALLCLIIAIAYVTKFEKRYV